MSVTFPYSHPEMAKDSYFGYKDTIQVPLGIEVLDYRREKKGETFIVGLNDLDTPVKADHDGMIVNNLIVRDHRPEIEKVYGKPADQLTPPEGYEFTGEFRRVSGEHFLTVDGNPEFLHSGAGYEPRHFRLILRKIEKKETVAPKAATYTAAEVSEKFGPSVLRAWGYHRLIDYPGFAYTGRLEEVQPNGWHCSAAIGPRQWKTKLGMASTFSSLTMVPTTEPFPRIVTFMLTEAAEFCSDEARYMPREDGSMEPVDPKEVPSQFYYDRKECA